MQKGGRAIVLSGVGYGQPAVPCRQETLLVRNTGISVGVVLLIAATAVAIYFVFFHGAHHSAPATVMTLPATTSTPLATLAPSTLAPFALEAQYTMVTGVGPDVAAATAAYNQWLAAGGSSTPQATQTSSFQAYLRRDFEKKLMAAGISWKPAASLAAAQAQADTWRAAGFGIWSNVFQGSTVTVIWVPVSGTSAQVQSVLQGGTGTFYST